jgi:hypothetical protein
MPGLASRLRAFDTIAHLEAAARQRFEEASLLYYGRRTYAAIYLYGYAIEMWLKAAYFHNEGIIAAFTDPISRVDRDRAWSQRIAAGAPNRSTNHHDIAIWADLLIYIRQTAGIYPPYVPLTITTLRNYAAIAYDHWNEEMRYQHLDPVHAVEVDEMRRVAEWFSDNYFSL